MRATLKRTKGYATNTINRLNSDLKICKQITIGFITLSVIGLYINSGDIGQMFGVLVITGFFIAIVIIGWIDTSKAIERYKKFIEEEEQRSSR